ncbi:MULTISPECIES: hypothetical protein [unclassified Pedobacter]|uniref:hypothetical protein n=1 Tax=unclassified Pedobacter TaxID=2628915 RepID=UPI00141EF186|nr:MULTISPECIES: hypothetical protein [unclassified Pedobacter]NII83351.1 hypothetical protein [Pedobacter sp. SG908]NMN37217.1 hypothetical protein [Pedobacter sp. SG918]
MKLPKYTLQHLLLITGMLFCFACKEEKPKEVKTEATKVQKNPFHFYKDIEVKPGLNFEIVSWGKGVDSIGGYQILMSDSVRNNYRSAAIDRKGILIDAWNMDLDNDGNPEFYIQLLSKKTVSDLNVFEYAGGNFNKISFPSLSANQKKGYTGNDNFFIKNGDLFRSFPVKDSTDSTKTITKTYQYKLSGNSFSTTEVKSEEGKGRGKE